MKRKKVIIMLLLCLLTLARSTKIYAYEDETTINVVVNGDKTSREYLRYMIYVSDNENKTNVVYDKFYSNVTTIYINGETYIYGEGTDIIEPYFDEDNSAYISTQSFGEIIVTQTIRIVKGETDNVNDTVLVSYDVQSLSDTSQAHKDNVDSQNDNNYVGLRVMEDIMINNDDKCDITVDDIPITNETIFETENLTYSWAVSSTEKDNIAYTGSVWNSENPYDSVTFANWDSVYETYWHYVPNNSIVISDAAVCYEWNERELASGSTISFSVNNNILVDRKVAGTISIDVKEDNNSKDTSKNNFLNKIVTNDKTPFVIVLVVAILSIGIFFVLSKKRQMGDK